MSNQYTLIDIENINELPSNYPTEFTEFCVKEKLKPPPKINTKTGIALSLMLHNKYKFWNRDTCDKLVKKFNIDTKDSIQLFNKHNQIGIKTSSGIEKGKYYIIYPYCLSNKYGLRKNNIYKGNKNSEIDKIKSTIKNDYINVPNSLWHLGHKNPNISGHLILQPPIQAKYKDNYIFIDPLTKFPMPHKLVQMLKKKELILTNEQIRNYKEVFDNLVRQNS